MNDIEAVEARGTPHRLIYLSPMRAMRKAFSFPSLLGMLLLAGAYAGRLGNLDQVSTATPSSSLLFWIDPDTWWHILVGGQILRTHVWPTHDPYSFTVHGSPWIAYEWLGEVVLDLFWKHGGLEGLMVFITVFAGIVMGLLYYYASSRSRSSKSAFVACALLLPLASLEFITRPQILGYIFLIVTLICLEKFRQGHSKVLWLLPVVFWLWVNTHGTFVLGFLILSICWATGLREFQLGRIYARRWAPAQRQKLELTFLLCLVASVLTPYGTRLAAYPLKMFSSQPLIVQTIQEWRPLDLSQFYGKLFVGLVVLFVIGVAATGLRWRLDDFLLFVFATAETLMHARFVFLFVPVFAPLAAELLDRWIPKYQPSTDRPGLNFGLIALIAFGMVKFAPPRSKLEGALRRTEPVGAVRYLKQHTGTGRMFNYSDWGGYLIFELAPGHQVFIDGRLDIYEYGGVFSDYLKIIRAQPNAPFLMRKYGVESCLIPEGGSLATLMVASPDWIKIYNDPTSVIFIKARETPNATRGNKSHTEP
jgi:hypothetical protein